jgi:hypothetical protein
MKSDSFKPINLIPAAVLPMLAPAMAMAAEGTSRVSSDSYLKLIYF